MRNGLRFLVPVIFMVAAAHAANPTLAVMDFSANNASAGDAAVLSELVREAVINSGAFTVVDKKNMDKLLQEQAFQRTGCTSEECAVKLGKVLNVQKMIVGSYSTLGQTRFLTARLVDVETGKSERSGTVKGFEVADADTASASLVNKLLGREDETPAPRTAAPPPEESYAKRPVENQPAQLAQSYAPPAASSASAGRGYAMIYAGPVGSMALTSYTRKSNYTWSSGLYTGEPTYTYLYDSYNGIAKSPALGVRIGAMFNAFAVDGELSFGKWATTSDPVTGHFTTFTNDYYGQHKVTTSATFTPVEGWLVVSSFNFGMNLYAVYPGKVVQPYVGIGGLMGLVNVSSESPNHVGINDEPLNATTLGFALQVPIGLRLVTPSGFFFWAEWRPVWEIVLSYQTGPTGLESNDSFTLKPKQGLFGVGFFFN